jgi:ribosomal protein S18 acetylase RimI-like enzyme
MGTLNLDVIRFAMRIRRLPSPMCPTAVHKATSRMHSAPSPLFARLDHASPTVAETIRRIMYDAYRVEAELIGRAKDFHPLGRTAEDIRTTDSVFIGGFLDGVSSPCAAGPEPAAPIAIAELERPASEDANSTAGRALNIASFVVHPAHFRRGVGSALLRHILDVRVHDHFAGAPIRITVSTAAANRPAIAFYEKHAFAITSRWITPDGIEMATLSRWAGAGH